jgi:ABC-type glycerol-3-phosphate transport system permease component
MATVQERAGRTLGPPVSGDAARAPERPQAKGTTGGRVLLLALLTGCSILFLVPFIWLISASLRPRAFVFDTSLLPSPFAPENYVTVWEAASLLSWLMNSLIIGVMAALSVTLKIALPLTMPALIVTLIFEFRASWTDLMRPLIYLRDGSLFTLPAASRSSSTSSGRGARASGRWCSPPASSPPCPCCSSSSSASATSWRGSPPPAARAEPGMTLV